MLGSCLTDAAALPPNASRSFDDPFRKQSRWKNGPWRSASCLTPHCSPEAAIGAGRSIRSGIRQSRNRLATSPLPRFPPLRPSKGGLPAPCSQAICRNRPLTEASYGAFDMKTTSLRILHTSDWHIGRTLYGRRRYETFSAFLDWLADTVRDRHVDVLIVAGDVFDTSAPSNRAQELYYRFLCRVMPFCRHIVVVAGNHDSPSFLTAPKELLRALNVHVVGSISDDPGHEILRLDGPDGEPELIVCAVPYLRDRDIRVVEPGEKALKTRSGTSSTVSAATTPPSARRPKTYRTRPDLPILATGAPLYASGGRDRRRRRHATTPYIRSLTVDRRLLPGQHRLSRPQASAYPQNQRNRNPALQRFPIARRKLQGSAASKRLPTSWILRAVRHPWSACPFLFSGAGTR